MKYLIFTFSLCMMQGISFAQDSMTPQVIPNVTLTSGKMLSRVVVEDVQPDGIYVAYDQGKAFIHKGYLPDDMKINYQKIFSSYKFSPDKDYDAVFYYIKKNLYDQIAYTRTEMAQDGASGECRDRFENRTTSLYSKMYNQVLSCKMRGYSSIACLDWIKLSLNKNICEGMPYGFVVIAWGCPERIYTSRTSQHQELTYGCRTVFIENDVVTEWNMSR